MPSTEQSAEEQQPALRMSRKHAGGGGASTRSYLFTILGEFVAPQGGRVWTSALITMLDKLGFEERAARQALARTAADGWLESERVGRKTCWRITPAAEQTLGEGRERLFNFRGVQDDWDGRWLVVMIRVPDAARAAGQKLRARLRWTGLGTPTPGLWVSTHIDRLAEVERVITREGLLDESQIFLSEHVGGAAPREVIRQAWDLDYMVDSYHHFLAEFQADYTSEPLVKMIRLAHAWRRFPMIDPGLPPELLPEGWDGIRAADRFRELHALWSVDANQQWRQLP